MKTNKMLKSVLAITVLSLIIYSGLTEYNKKIIIENDAIETSGNGFGHSVNVLLIIENERNGEIIYRMEKNDDLALRSFAGLIHYMIKGTDTQNSYYYRIDTGASTVINLEEFIERLEKDVSIYIGTGTTAPAYEDWRLEALVYSDRVEAIGYSYSVLKMNATLVSTFNILNTYAITECGLDLDIRYNALVFRDVFGAINVISGDVLTVKYIIMFN